MGPGDGRGLSSKRIVRVRAYNIEYKQQSILPAIEQNESVLQVPYGRRFANGISNVGNEMAEIAQRMRVTVDRCRRGQVYFRTMATS